MDVKINEKAGTLTITVPLQDPKRSKSGKTDVIATASGETDKKFKGKQVFVSFNAYIKR